MPLALLYVWDAWTRLRRRAGASESGPVPVSWSDIDAFARRTGTRLDPRDVDLIEDLDDLFLSSFNAEDEGVNAQAIRDGVQSASKGVIRHVRTGREAEL